MIDMGDELPFGSDGLKVYARDGIGWIVFNRPEKRNAISLAMWDTIHEAFSRFTKDDDIRVVVMRGAGLKAFSAGADRSEFDALRFDSASQDLYLERASRGKDSMVNFGKPLIAMIAGYCLGGGMAIALRADLRIASSDSTFGFPAATIGLAPAIEALQQMVSLTGPGIAKEIVFTGRQFSAAEALGMRLINAVAEPDRLEQTVMDMALRIARNAPLSIRAAKLALDQIVADPAATDRPAVKALMDQCAESEDYEEGRRAFKEKRRPEFRGR